MRRIALVAIVITCCFLSGGCKEYSRETRLLEGYIQNILKMKSGKDLEKFLNTYYKSDGLMGLSEDIWPLIVSSEQQKEVIGYQLLKHIRNLTDAGSTLGFARFCWFKIRENPLIFYQVALKNQCDPVFFYRIATMYDEKAFSWDKIKHQEVLETLENALFSIKEYNIEKGINDREDVKAMEDKIEKHIEERYIHDAHAYRNRLMIIIKNQKNKSQK